VAWTGVLLALFILPSLCRAPIFLRSPEGWDYVHFWSTFRSPFHMSLEGLIIGVAIAMAQQSGFVRQSRRSGLALLTGSGVLLALWMATGDFMAQIDGVDVLARPPLIALLIGGLLLGGVKLTGTAMPLKRPAQVIARLSYSLYLIHFPLIPLAMALGLTAGIGGFWFAYLVISAFGALLIHTIVEKPFLAWKERIAGNGHAKATSAEALPSGV
jgi:peptidoglycan/LPS O-acetylase OafA/YrhL